MAIHKKTWLAIFLLVFAAVFTMFAFRNNLPAKAPYSLDQRVDTLEWKEYKNPAYGYMFRYPQTWKTLEPKSTNPDYLKYAWIRLISPNNPRRQDVLGLTEFPIVVERFAGDYTTGIGGLVVTLEDLKTLESELESKVVPVKLTKLPSNNGFQKIILSDIGGDPSNTVGFVFGDTKAFRIAMGGGFTDGLTTDDKTTFLGILETFEPITASVKDAPAKESTGK